MVDRIGIPGRLDSTPTIRGNHSTLEHGAHRVRMQKIGAAFHSRGWSLGTSSNYSVVVSRNPLTLLITASGKDKGRLGDGDFVLVDATGRKTDLTDAQPSAETLLHTVVAGMPNVGAVLHTHSVWATLLSDHYGDDGSMVIDGYEMLKGLDGVRTHEHRQRVAIFDNSQDIAALAERVRQRLYDESDPLRHGFLIRRHGLYTWGHDLAAAERHVEIFEFLFEVLGRRLCLPAR